MPKTDPGPGFPQSDLIIRSEEEEVTGSGPIGARSYETDAAKGFQPVFPG